MKLLSKSALSAAIASGIATAIAASAVQAETVTIDPSLTFTYKNYYWKQNNNVAKDATKTNKKGEVYKKDRDEWVHGIIADFDTGYVNDVIGAVVTAGFSDPISVEKNSSMTNVTRGQDGKANGLAGVQQAYVKAKYDLSEVSLKGSYGVKKRGYGLYNDSGSRVLDSSTTGLDLSGSAFGLTVYGSQIDGFSARNESQFSEDLTNEAGTKIDKLQIVGAAYEVAGLGLTAEYGKSTDYIKKSVFKADYSFDIDDAMSVDLDARYGKAKENGKLYDDQDYKSSYYNLNATLNFGAAYVGAGYNKTKDGDYDNAFFDGDHGTFNSSLAQWEDYSLEDEKAFVVTAGYDFDEMVPGLSLDVWYAKGKDAKDVDNFKRREYGSYVSYAFDGQLEGLSLAWLHVNYRSNGTATGDRGTELPDTIYDGNVNRFYLTYQFVAF